MFQEGGPGTKEGGPRAPGRKFRAPGRGPTAQEKCPGPWEWFQGQTKGAHGPEKQPRAPGREPRAPGRKPAHELFSGLSRRKALSQQQGRSASSGLAYALIEHLGCKAALACSQGPRWTAKSQPCLLTRRHRCHVCCNPLNGAGRPRNGMEWVSWWWRGVDGSRWHRQEMAMGQSRS